MSTDAAIRFLGKTRYEPTVWYEGSPYLGELQPSETQPRLFLGEGLDINTLDISALTMLQLHMLQDKVNVAIYDKENIHATR